MKAPFGETVFSVGGRDYVWEDVVIAAHFWGEWHEDSGSETLERLAWKLAGRAAVFDRLSERAKEPLNLLPEDLAAVIESLPPEVRESGLPGVSRPAMERRMAFLARLEVAFREFCNTTLRADVEREIIERVDWVGPQSRQSTRERGR